ncbi:hybrid sensor histidine kinase/response regulator [Aureliella helgolandensis]|uniref:Sensory/regulatory protein RpfC n=1 Tax=Aureliella helgolandensis TaxID=2527968 RepID=A0A518GDF3_9BACT|nr:PAS domain-containing protein [Aureliella helgolandensis]QDV26636.1 Signal transduction histidine-protein kinase BarA [Aureliella helgolandensis]
MPELNIEAISQQPATEVLERLSDFAFLCSRDGRKLSFVNSKAAAFLGWTSAELCSFRPWWEQVLCLESHALYRNLIEHLDTSTSSQPQLAPLALPCQNTGGASVTMTIHSVFISEDSLLLLGSRATDTESPDEVLRQTQARFRSIVDSLSINLVLKDTHGRRIYANRAYLERRNLTLADILGKTDHELFPSDLAEQFKSDDAKVLQAGEVIHKFEENVSSDGKRQWNEIVKGPLRDADGQITGVQILFWDATVRKATELALERERYLLHALLDNVPDSIYFKDQESRFMRISRGMAEKFNLPNTTVAIGKTDADIFTDEHALQAREDEMRIMETGAPMVAMVERETWPHRDDTWCSTTKMQLRDSEGTVVGTFGISRDITEMMVVEQQLRDARDQAHQASQAKSAFLANMSHEIRTPINGIIGMAELMNHTNLNDAQRSFLEMVQQSAHSLLRIINDILDFSKIEAGKLDIESLPFELRKCVSQAAKSLAIRAAKKTIELVLKIAPDVPEHLMGDADRLRQILINLVGNAIKFTDSGSITIEVVVVNGPPTVPDYTLHFSVKDTGIGIPKNKQTVIFEAFSQADASTTRQYGGTGLGLSISSQLVTMMGGKIWLASELGVGSTFHFTCRMPTAPEPDRSADSERPPLDLTGLHLLLVDDNYEGRSTLAAALQRHGLQVLEASNAEQAAEQYSILQKAPSDHIALIVDQVMPHIDGSVLIERLLQSAPRQPITILLSSAVRPLHAENAAAQENLLVLQKPALQSEICEAIRRTLAPPAPPAASPQNTPPPTRPESPLRLLVAEDGEVNRAVIVGLLQREGHDVTVAEDGTAAVDAWEEFEFDGILMDVQMPVMDGIEATLAIRMAEEKQASKRRVPIIAVTAAALASDAERCLEAGMDDYLSKPIDFGELEDLLQRLRLHKERGDRQAAFLPTDAHPPLTQTATQHRPESPKFEVNFEAPLKKLKCSPEQQLMLVQTLERETTQRLGELAQSIANHDDKLLIRAAHSLKSAANLFEAKQVTEAARSVEELARSGDLNSAIEQIAELRGTATLLLESIQEWLAHHQ